jgi:L-fucose mutarotase/ribose pyranase (RbsD/FucU family)
MMKIRYVPALLLFALMPFAAERTSPATAASSAAWNRTLLDRIPLYGHRNWIVIADSAYPAQSRPGIETIVSNSDHVQVLEQVLAAVSASRHVRPIVYTDQELKFIEEKDAPGISAYRRQLAAVLQNRAVNSLPHEQIIAKLDQVSQTFRVLIIKTNFTLPYTSVFLQLDCAYWGADAERRLRAAMAKQHHP